MNQTFFNHAIESKAFYIVFLKMVLAHNPYKIETNAHKHVPPTAKKAQKLILQNLIQEKANQYNLTAEVIASSKTLLSYIRGDPSVNFLNSWRYNLLKEKKETK